MDNSKTMFEKIAKDWTKISQDELVRGLTPDNIEKRCLELCQTYIGGSWVNAKTLNEISVKRISGGFTNQFYHVQLGKSVVRVHNDVYPNEPSDVAIKFYQEKHMKNYNSDDDERFNDMIILTIMSQKELGPIVYGIFSDGFIQGYYEHEQFRAKHQENPNLCQKVIRLLAQINHLNVPIRKDSNLLFTDMKGMIEFAYKHCKVNELAEKLDLKNLKQVNVLAEYQSVMSQISALNAPIVFCHNDFRGSNLLVTKNENILACDLEYCGYGTRGFDLACIIKEWGKKDLFHNPNENLKDDVIEKLVKLYIEEIDKLVPGYSKQPENSFVKHLNEIRLMLLANNLFFISLMMKQQSSIVSSIPFDPKIQMQFVDLVLKNYIDTKNSFIEKGFLPKF